jgi:hypothetical protein
MRDSAVNTLLIILALLNADLDQPPPALSPENKAEAEQASATATERVAGYAVRLAESLNDQLGGERQLKREPDPVLRWTNHLNRRFYGDIYLWTYEGRPEVVASVTTIFTASAATYTEIQSLSTGRPILSRDEKNVWEPAEPAVTFQPLPGAPKPGATAANRLRQMRELAAQFSVVAEYVNEQKEALRLLTTPIYRYQSAAQGVSDGALFAFTKGTDPDAFLLIEARGEKDSLSWQYAFARFNGSCDLRAVHKGDEVWQVNRLPGKMISDPKQPYFNFR